MRKGDDIAVQFPGLFVVHHNKPGSDVDHHRHPEHHLIIPLQGEATVHLEAESLNCGPGRMIYVAPDTLHAFSSGRDKGERLICMMDKKLWQKAEGPTVGSQVLPLQHLIRELLFYLLLNQMSRSTSALIDALVHALVDALEAGSGVIAAGMAHVESKTEHENVIRAMAYLRAYRAENIGMTAVAKAAGLSLRSLNRLFLDEVGLTPKQFVTAIRIEEAKDMLRGGKKSVTEVAFAVGYNSLSQFINTFRHVTGMIPSEFARGGKS